MHLRAGTGARVCVGFFLGLYSLCVFSLAGLGLAWLAWQFPHHCILHIRSSSDEYKGWNEYEKIRVFGGAGMTSFVCMFIRIFRGFSLRVR